MAKALYQFLADEGGQDLVEYTLLIAVIGISVVGVLKNQGTAIAPMWVAADNNLHSAIVAAS